MYEIKDRHIKHIRPKEGLYIVQACTKCTNQLIANNNFYKGKFKAIKWIILVSTTYLIR